MAKPLGYLGQLYKMITNSIGVFRITGSSGSEKIGTCNGTIYGTRNRKIAMIQQFGFASLPPDGSEGILSAIAGNRENSYITSTHHRASYPSGELSDGGCMIYHKDGITFVKLDAMGNIVINQVGSTGTIIINGNVSVVGNITATGNIIGANFP